MQRPFPNGHKRPFGCNGYVARRCCNDRGRWPLAKGDGFILVWASLTGVIITSVGEVCQLEKITGGAAGQIGDLLSKCSERASFPRFSSFFFVVSEKDEEVLVGRGGPCGMSLGVCRTPSRIGGDVHSVGTPVKCQAW
jgi:hypothetical protein